MTPHPTGSARALTGKTVILACYVSSSAEPWDPRRKEAIWALLEEAEAFLIGEAQRYEVEVLFHNTALGHDADVVLPRLPTGPDDDLECGQAIAAALGHGSSRELGAALLADHDAARDNALVLVFANGGGRAFVLPVAPGRDVGQALATAVLFREEGGAALDAATLARELLHLFGARDLNDAVDATLAARAAAHCPGDAMIELCADLVDNNIGPLTAHLVGWTAEREDWFAELLPPGTLV